MSELITVKQLADKLGVLKVNYLIKILNYSRVKVFKVVK